MSSTRNRAELMPPVDRIRGGGASWLSDGSGFFYSRLAADWQTRLVPNASGQHGLPAPLGRPAADVAVFGPTVHPDLKLMRSDSGAVFLLDDQPLGVAIVNHGVSRYISLYVSDKAALLAGQPVCAKCSTNSRGGRHHRASGMALPALCQECATLPGAAPASAEADMSKAEVLVAGGPEVITAIAAAREGCT